MLTKLRPTHLKPAALVLMALMAVTRFHHFGDAISLPDASLAAFFLAGLWSGGIALFAILLLQAGLIDYLAIAHFGVSDFCISPAYLFLIPTYASVWFGGRCCRSFSSLRPSDLTAQSGILLGSVSLAFLISNGSFFLLSENIADTSWAAYINNFMQYYPAYLQYAVVYVVALVALQRMLKQLTVSGLEKEITHI